MAEENAVLTNGDLVTTSNGDVDFSEPKSKVVEFDCQSADISNDSSSVQKFSSKLKEDAGTVGGKAFKEKDYEESVQKSHQEKKGNTDLACSSSLQLAEKERVSETAGGGVKTEYAVGSDELYRSEGSTIDSAAGVSTHRSADSRYSKACSKIDERLPGNGDTHAVAQAEAGRRVTEASRADYSHAERIATKTHGPRNTLSTAQGNLEESSSDQSSQSTVTTAGGASLQVTSSKKVRTKREVFTMESSEGTEIGEGAAAAAEGATAIDSTSAAGPEDIPAKSTEPSKPGEIKLSTKISSENGDIATGSAASAGASVTLDAPAPKETTSGGTSNALYNRQQPSDATPSDNMSVSSVSSAHEQNDIKMSSASSSECAFSSSAKMDTTASDFVDKNKDFKYNRKTTDNLVKRILGDSEADRKSKYKINMGTEDEENEGDTDRDSLLQRRLASLEKTGPATGGRRAANYMSEEYEHEETTYSARRARGRGNRSAPGSGDLDSPRRLPGRQGSRGSRGSFEYDDDYDDDPRYGYGPPPGYGLPQGFRGGRGRFARQQYIDDEDMYGPPMVPLFRDEEFVPQKRDETEEYVKEKTANIRGMVDRQTVVLENLRKASESFDELTDEIKNIRQAFIENQARRAMLFHDDEMPPGDMMMEQPGHPRGGGPQGPRARSRYVQQAEQDYEYAMKDQRTRKLQHGDDYGFEPSAAGRGRQKQYGLEAEDKDDFALSLYGSKGSRGGANKELDDFGPRSLGAGNNDYGLGSYGKARGLDKADYKSSALKKSSYYSQEERTSGTVAAYGGGSDAYASRHARGLGTRSKSLYDEASGGDEDAVDALGRRGRVGGGVGGGLQRTLHDPLNDDPVQGAKDRYVSAYGGGGTPSAAAGYTRLGSSGAGARLDSGSAGSTAATNAYSARSSYTSSRLASQSASTTTARPRFTRSRTLSDLDFDRGDDASPSPGFQSRFLGKVRQRSSAGEDPSRHRDKPFKSRFLRSSFDLGDGSSPSDSYTSITVSERFNKNTTATESTAKDSSAEGEKEKE